MADICKCKGTKCSVRETCYRYKAKGDKYRQTYFVGTPGKNENCEYYWEMTEGITPDPTDDTIYDEN